MGGDEAQKHEGERTDENRPHDDLSDLREEVVDAGGFPYHTDDADERAKGTNQHEGNGERLSGGRLRGVLTSNRCEEDPQCDQNDASEEAQSHYLVHSVQFVDPCVEIHVKLRGGISNAERHFLEGPHRNYYDKY